MNKLKLFLENFLIFGLGGILSKVIPLVMVPVVTRLMPDPSYFGISDMSNTVVSFGGALAVMGMYDAMYRMFFDREEEAYKKEICSTAVFFTLGSSILVSAAMLLWKDIIAERFFGDIRYGYLVSITAAATLVGATNSIVAAPTRMQNQRKVFLVMNTLTPLLSYSVALPLLLRGHYVAALPIAGMLAALSAEAVFLVRNRRWFSLKAFRPGYLKPLLQIAVPLLPNFLVYWIFNSSDKLMLTNLLGTGATGIYSVGAKLGHASQLIYIAFAGGWQFFAFSTMKEEDQVATNSRVFEYLGILSFGCTMFVFAVCRPLYRLLFTGDYVEGYMVSPYLFLAPLLQMLFQVASNQFLVIKKTWPNFFILLGGAIINVALNLTLIPRIGIEGAALATLAGYLAADVVVAAVLVRMKLMVVSGRFLLSSLLLGGYVVIWRLFLMPYPLWSLGLSFVCAAVYLVLYRKDIRVLLDQLKSAGKIKEG